MAGTVIITPMEKIVEQGLLYDFYGPLLTEHQQKIYEKVVYENLALVEIAEEDGISRQAVHDLLRRCTGLMERYERKLGLIERFKRLGEDADALEALTGETGDEALSQKLQELAEKIRRDLQ